MAHTVFHVAFPISEPVKERAFNVIAAIRAAEDPRRHVGELTDVIVAMTEEGLKYLFVDSLHAARVNSLHIQAVQMGVNTARKGLEMVGRQVLKAMSADNLRGIADYMEQILLEVQIIEVENGGEM